MIDYTLILSVNYSDKQWSMVGNSYDNLLWISDSEKPTQNELDSLWQSTQDSVAKDACKTKAKELIAATDWAVLPDVGLANVSDFTAYRATLRQLILNPVADPVWPTEPTPVWS